MKVNDNNAREDALLHLKARLDSYFPLSEKTWAAFTDLCELSYFASGEMIYSVGDFASTFSFIHRGLARVFLLDANGQEYNKRFFVEGEFPGCMSALLTQTRSELGVQVLEPTVAILIDFTGFRELLSNAPDLMQFHIHYLETNWLLEKDKRDSAFARSDARTRYLNFKTHFPTLYARLPQYHIASHLGITPVQLSRIRKKLANSITS